jgi:Vitamin K-dependent gamma-carboxylase
MGGLIRRWIGLWSREEHPRSLALIRLIFGGVVLVDFLRLGQLGLVRSLFAAKEAGGLGDPLSRAELPWLYALLREGEAAAWLGWGICTASALLIALGLGTRLAAAALVLFWAQLALALPPSDRGIDMLMRNVALVLVFADSGATWGLGCRLRHGTWSAPEAQRVSSWPRYLLLVQLVIVYFAAGVSKVATSWLPMGGWSALYIAMLDPAFQRVPEGWLRPLYPLTQVGTLSTWLWEWSAPLLLLAMHFRDTRLRPGRLRAWMNRVEFLHLYLLIGATFHLGTHLTLQLGIFPFAVMALYPAAWHPDELRALLARLPLERRPVLSSAA